ncbi:MAG: glycosyltransferase family 2 protein [Bernardetiaceae bacterium]|jgi:GT2 family glycosyltransferase|nr:glycosyltransferase family 2 protein [Bernardetiaceae bacterium]
MSRTAVVILNYNGLAHLQQFLPSVLAHTPHAEVIVADNGSTDGSVAWLEHAHPRLRLILMPQNTGFSQGYNQALEWLKGEFEFYVLLNSDVAVTPGWLGPLLATLRANPRAVACQPKILAYPPTDGRFEYAGAGGGYLDYLGYPFCRGRLFDDRETDHGQYDDTRPVFWASGACLLVRAEAYHRFGGLDPDFFAHMEEIDLCWRWKNAGLAVLYCGQATVYHLGGGTLAYASPRKSYLNFRNGLAMLIKNLPPGRWLPVVLARLVLDGVAGLRFLLAGQVAQCWAIVKAHFYLYAHAGRLARARRAAQATATHWPHPEMMPRSLVWAFFGQRKRTFLDLGWVK